MDDNADFSSPEIDNATLTDPTFTATQDLVPNTEYSWRVRAVNGLGEMSNWSAVRYLRAAMLPPTLVSPTEPFASMELRPMFTWNAPPGTGAITGYTIQFSKNNLFTQIVHTGNPAGPSYLPTADLPKNATLYWRVLAKGANGPSSYSTSRALTTPSGPPPTPVLMMPGNNAPLTSYTNPIFKWKAISMLDASFLHYRVQVADNGAFSSPLIDDTSITNRLTTQLPTSLTLLPDSRYYWRVRAVSTSGELSNWSATWCFRAAFLPPTLFMPADDSGAVLRKPLLDWSDVAGNTGYTLQVWKAGTTPVLVKTVTLATNVSQYQFITTLLPNTAYYWKLQTKGINGPSLWTDPFDFVTGS